MIFLNRRRSFRLVGTPFLCSGKSAEIRRSTWMDKTNEWKPHCSAALFPEFHDSVSIAKRITDSNLRHRMRQMFSNPFQRIFSICHARSTGDPDVCGIRLRQSVTSALLRSGAQAWTRERNRNRIAVCVNYGFSISSSRSSASRRISAELISSLRMRMLATSI